MLSLTLPNPNPYDTALYWIQSKPKPKDWQCLNKLACSLNPLVYAVNT